MKVNLRLAEVAPTAPAGDDDDAFVLAEESGGVMRAEFDELFIALLEMLLLMLLVLLVLVLLLVGELFAPEVF
jgi:hypothetical protein